MNEEILSPVHWYALYTKPRHEFRVNDQLLTNNFNTYLPVLKELRQWHDRKKRINSPLFPGYLFIRCQMDKINYYNILNIKGIVYVVGNKWPSLSKIPDNQISSMKLTLESKLPVNVISSLKKGDHIYIKSGVLQGVVGTLVRKNNSRMCIVIMINTLNKGLQIEVDCRKCQIEKL